MRRRLIAVLVVVLVAAACSYTPPKVDVAVPTLAQSTKIYAADGTVLTTLQADENREDVRLDDLPKLVPDAVVAIEDARFWEHKGVDVKGVLRAAVANSTNGTVVEGGSTITQQYVKNTFLDPDQTVGRKVKEALFAIQLERRYTKRR